MENQSANIRIGITQGDLNGIGLEVIVKALANSDILELFTPVIFGDASILGATADRLQEDDFRFDVIPDASAIEDGRINVINVSTSNGVHTPGTPSPLGGRAAVAALQAASKAIEEGHLDILVTAPIDKNTAQGEEFHFPGHTEYLEDRFAVGGGKAMMILADGPLRVSLVTTHVPLSHVPQLITKESVEESIRAFNRALRMDFGCERPRIAVLSLNPHCGDNGVIGTEETEKIIPAVEACKKDGILAFGPIAADGLFGSGAYLNFDGVLAMYHDQGLAPFKALASGGGVNFTAGLDIVRTSPAHGTAYDKAGKGVADASSMRQAIYEAIDIARRRDSYLEASENPLEIRVPMQRGPKKGKERQADPDASELAPETPNDD